MEFIHHDLTTLGATAASGEQFRRKYLIIVSFERCRDDWFRRGGTKMAERAVAKGGVSRGRESAKLTGHAPVAQLDRAPGFEPGGRRFESVRARQNRQ
jgi:hypothetical protein